MANARSKAASKRRLFQAKAKVTKSGAKAKAPSTAKVTSSAKRGARVKASKAQISQSERPHPNHGKAKVTASGGGSARTPGGPNKADAGQWKKLNQSAKTSGKGPVKGAPGTSGAPTNAKPTARTAKGQVTANKMKRVTTAARGARAAAGKAAAARVVGKGAAHVGAAAAGLNAGKVADGTMKGKPTGAKQGPPAPKAKATPKDFGSAFKAARAAGKKEFTWNGKSYHTRRADGK